MSRKKTIHGIDPYAPGGIEALLAHHRLTFGDAVMQDPGETPPPAGETPPDDPPAPPAGDEPLGDGGKKALQSERDARSTAEKALTAANARIKELEDAAKSDDDKRNERFAELEKSDREKDVAIAERDAKLMRYEVAAAKGLDLKAALRLQGSTKEEIEADADEFAKSFVSGGVGEVPGAGARGSTEVKTTPGIGTLKHAYETSSK